MEKAECIKFILSDKDLVRRVKEWISKREDIQQASLAASSFNSMALDHFLTSLSNDDFDQMIQDLDIGKALTASRSCTSSRDGLASAYDHVITKLDDDSHDNDVEWDINAMTNLKITPSKPEIKSSEITVSRIEVSSDYRVVFDVYDEDEDKDLKTKANPMAATRNFPPAPESKTQDTEELNVHDQRNPNKCSNPGEEATAFRSPGSMDMTENSPDSQTFDYSSTEEDGSQQNYVRNEPIPRRTSNMSDPAEQNSAFEQCDHDLRQPRLLEASDRSSVVGNSDQGPPAVTYGTVRRASTEDRAREHAYPSPLSGDLYQSGNYQHSHGPRLENLGDARQSTRFPDQNPVQNPLQQLPVGLQSPNPNSSQLNFQNPCQLPPETLHAIVMMLNRELIRRGNQPIRCDSCANLQAEIKNLRKSSRCLGQQLELLKWNYILLEEFIKHLEEILKQKENDNKESLQVIRFFHEKMVERKNELSNLKKEIEVMRNKFEEERKQLYEKADNEDKEQSQLCEQMKKQTEMLERVNEKVCNERHENQVLQEKLKQKSEESQKENQLLKEENKRLTKKLKASEARVNQLELRNQTLEEEKRTLREAFQRLEEEYICREAQFNERINQEIKQLMDLFENLKDLAQRHGFLNSFAGLNLERENDSNFPPP
ncbi:putative mediator of RNA polymerase II transcription subunit 26 [Actinia tenebrosa]|uniref:Mediator of RNA polymerase II transcription subunit 26 n=1 Tax=Actinia tenebrosa TaxID=6105 RepID=A0A6P8HDW3_ACTTE|nr:putative mediator of RNA polymerase II transcription subunit 26 [Actinia tenebrosa]